MTAIADSSPAVASSVIAGLLLAARDHQHLLGLPGAEVEQILEKTVAARSSAYEAKAKLLGLLPTLVRPVGRPPAVRAAPAPAADALCHEVLRFVMDHPGCIHGGPDRRHYSDSFRRLVLDLREKHPALGVEELAHAVEVPVDTLRDWLRAPAPPETEASSKTDPTSWGTGNLHVQAILAEWDLWEGKFLPFCEHVAEHLRVPYKRTAMAAILEAHGVRLRKKRDGRSPDETALRDAFQTFFPGAQWVADGTKVVVRFFDQAFAFNVELNVDAHTGAFVGASIRDEEDSAALLQSLEDGKVTTGAPPLAELVDNRPSNLTPEVRDALAAEGTLLIPATQGRPQNKGHVEGAFGLFRQMAPPIALNGETEREAARELLRLVVTTWARTLNHRPRTDRRGKSRVDLYFDTPTPEQIADARAELQERLRRQEAARRTQQARQDPVVRQTIAAAFTRLGIADPDGHVLDAVAGHPLSPVVDGIAICEGRRAAGSLPRDLDTPGRYLLGIVRNVAQQREGELISDAMLRARLEAQDALLAPLVQLRHRIEQPGAAAPQTLASFVDNALDTERTIDRLFWLSSAGDLIR
ncbi:MAG: hypothetical protein HY901_05475, partial [Deltaproteobacteria bacterium]|nr:hypothetical protein [Deltaproteobacteria bacterium]